MKLFSAFDLLPILIFIVGFLLFSNVKFEKSDNFEIYYNKQVIKIPLMSDTVINVNLVSIEFKNKSAKVLQSNCENQICVATKAISSSGQIICAPNKVVVLLQGKESEIDVYTK